MSSAILIQWSNEDQAYLVTLPGWTHKLLMPCTHGATYEEAAKNGQEVLEMLQADEGTTEDQGPQLMLLGEDDDEALPYQEKNVKKFLGRQDERRTDE